MFAAARRDFSNNGKIRGAWLAFRRAANVAQMLGLHREIPALARTTEFGRRAKLIWRSIIGVDVKFSLLLGVHGAISSTAEGLEVQQIPLVRVANLIVERNQTFTKVTPAMIRKTQEIDEILALILPPELQSPDGLPEGKCHERFYCFQLLHCRLTYYQHKAWLHLPLLLDASAENPHLYHRRACLEACRHLIDCYINLRLVTQNGCDSKIFDFEAFTAAMTIVINSVGPFGQRDIEQDGWDALESVVAVLERLYKTLERLSKAVPPDDVASRALNVLLTLRGISEGREFPELAVPSESPDDLGRPSRIQLDLPYFGTIFLERRTWAEKTTQSRHFPCNLNNTFHIPSPTVSDTTPGVYAPPNSWINTILDPRYARDQVPKTAQWAGPDMAYDPPAEFWAMNADFTFQLQPPYLNEFDIDWSNCDFGLL
ncbi:transcriptional regulator family: Fungal Specific TF [Penicillium soppii]|uniref:transcriptional regulator family: Fungal Specific TF n=1 Tax=Penicillium soppii TaxID=69789 RepID=UPI0025476A4D|nr:transcriptional regulator family: Fungal Specific TF [Penicillium soppii]KAJ5871715.1 transcriptional regulator family: Fungal Specific TF [Penicillium soppii]